MHHAAVRVLTATACAVVLLASPRLAAAQAIAAPTPATAAMTPAQRHDWERAHRMSKIIGSDVHTRAG